MNSEKEMPKQEEKQQGEKVPAKSTKSKPKKGAETKKKQASREAGAAPKKRGVPSEYPIKIQPYLSEIGKYARCGVTEGQLAEYYGVGKTSWAKYKKENPEFDETLSVAKREFKTDLCNRSYEVAMGYDYTEETTVTVKDTKGNVTGTKTTVHRRHAKADAGMLQFLLINRFSDEFARDPQVLALRKRALELAEAGKVENLEGL